jgi:ribosome-associated protein
MKNNELRSQVALAVRACLEKKAEDIAVLQLDEQASGFTDYFLLCSGANPRQVQAIADEIDHRLSAIGVQPKHTEGYTQADWLLMDYVDFVVHIFSESARRFYGLERLWKTATRVELADLEKPARKPAASRASKRAAAAAKSSKTPAKSAPRKRAQAKHPRKSS